jgi:TonB-dependent receptor
MGIARPIISDLVPFITENDQRNELDVGNPELKATRANNVDVLIEHYFQSVGVISAAGFYKDLHDPIYRAVRTPITTGPNAGFVRVQATNGPKARVYGVELTWQQQLTFLPGALNGLGVRANYTHAWSQASFPSGAGRTDKPALLRQAPDLFNVGVTYDRYGFSTRVGVTYNGASIYQYNYQDGATGGVTGPNGDVYLYSRAQLDAQVSYRFRTGLEVYANGLNLNNAAFGFYQGGSPYTIQREYYGLSTSFGVRLSR